MCLWSFAAPMALQKTGQSALYRCRQFYAHFGLKVPTYCDAGAYGLLKAAIREDNPVVFLESELTYGVKGEVADEEHIIPIGQAHIRRPGSDVTLISWGKQVFQCDQAVAAWLNKASKSS